MLKSSKVSIRSPSKASNYSSHNFKGFLSEDKMLFTLMQKVFLSASLKELVEKPESERLLCNFMQSFRPLEDEPLVSDERGSAVSEGHLLMRKTIGIWKHVQYLGSKWQLRVVPDLFSFFLK